ncbi:uncharacterized protein LOC105388067 [Plutella xylostella]|uniref:uncharacterized protein LOC105388067 n=1 Tax=Plutella xylostella TaxID=51655 RepID=UPI00203319FC|nr:uncharacterized protein LOC105388067 [Plutella xylostella]XP_048483221.1 uncharacterized protein LOC105388067 [Plutella xylostella]
MDPLHQGHHHTNGQVLPHIVQVYESAADNDKLQDSQIIHITPALPSQGAHLTFQPLGHNLNVPVSGHNATLPQDMHMQHHPEDVLVQHLSLTQMLGTEMHIGQHIVLPQHHVVLNAVPGQYYGQFEAFHKEASPGAVAKLEPEVTLVVDNKLIDYKQESLQSQDVNVPCLDVLSTKKKTHRSPIRNPDKWACNLRKLKHQRGEAYISRRGKYVPPKQVRTTKDCLNTCKYKCSTMITDADREHLFKAYYSLSSNEKKHFLLNTTERSQVKHSKKDGENQKRRYSFRYFFLVRAVRYAVCKHFYLGTLAISQKPVYNVHLGKSDWNIPKPDGRGLSEASAHTLPSEIKDRVRKHIQSFKTIDEKPIEHSQKKQYLGGNVSIKHMFRMYAEQCRVEGVESVKESMYRKILKNEFNLQFKRVKVEQQLCCKCKGPVKKK